MPFTGDADADEDGDGLSVLFEYAIGSSDADPSDQSPVGIRLEAFEIGGQVSDSLVITVPMNLAAAGVEVSLESSDNMIDWAVAGDLEHVASMNLGNGLAIRTYRSKLPVDSGKARQFIRLRVDASF